MIRIQSRIRIRIHTSDRWIRIRIQEAQNMWMRWIRIRIRIQIRNTGMNIDLDPQIRSYLFFMVLIPVLDPSLWPVYLDPDILRGKNKELTVPRVLLIKMLKM